MKSEKTLRLRQAGKHCATKHSDLEWQTRLGVWGHMATAFERNAVPKHSTESPQEPYVTINYVTGVWKWHGRIIIHPEPMRLRGFENITLTPSETS